MAIKPSPSLGEIPLVVLPSLFTPIADVAGTEISASDLEHKIRLLTLATLAFKHIGQNLPYSKVAEALQVDISEVEKWVIDGVYSHVFSGARLIFKF